MFGTLTKTSGNNIKTNIKYIRCCVTIILKNSGLYNEKFGSFINQNVDSLLTDTVKKISTATTDIASLAENIYRGGGTQTRRLKQRRRCL